MIPEALLSPVLANLGENTAACLTEREKRLGHLSELAFLIAEQVAASGGTASPFAFFPAAAALLAELRENVPASLLATPLPSDLAGADGAHLARFLLEEAERRLSRPLTLLDFADGVVPPPARSRTVYVDNPHAAEAYRRFSAVLPSPTLAHRENFRELFDDVENGYAEYAVLPLFSEGVRIASVFRMIEEYGHSIAAVTSLPVGEGEAVFGLLSRRSVCLGPVTHSFLSSSLEGIGLSGLLSALPVLGLREGRIEPLPPPPGRSHTLFGVEVMGDERAFVTYLAYRSLLLPGCLGGGFYLTLA